MISLRRKILEVLHSKVSGAKGMLIWGLKFPDKGRKENGVLFSWDTQFSWYCASIESLARLILPEKDMHGLACNVHSARRAAAMGDWVSARAHLRSVVKSLDLEWEEYLDSIPMDSKTI